MAVPRVARRLRLSLICTLLVALGAAPAVAAPPVPRIGNCPIFTPDNPWNQRVDHLPSLRGSARMIERIGSHLPLHPDFGSGRWQGGLIGIPFTTVGHAQGPIPIAFSDATYSDPGPYPIPLTAAIEDRPDRHVVTVDTHSCRLYEIYREAPQRGTLAQPSGLDQVGGLPQVGDLPQVGGPPSAGGQGWRAGSGATWDLTSDRLRPEGWTSADAAGLPIFPGLVRHEEVEEGEIRHALRIAVPMTRRAWIYPARHASSALHDPTLPSMGQRLRLRRRVNANSFPPQARVVVRALKRYGALVADQGSPRIHLTGAPSQGWDMSQVFALSRLRTRDFEVVNTQSLSRPAP